MILESGIVYQLLTILASAVVAYVGKRIGDKFGIEAQKDAELILERASERAVSAVEERVAEAIKNAEEKLSSNEKLQAALEFVDDAVPTNIQKKIGKNFRLRAVKEIESALGRIEKVGATGLDAFIRRF
jgi:pheromone shutdown protein TraB